MFSNINDNDQSSLMKTFTAGRAQITAGFVFIDADPDIGAGPKPELMSLHSLFTRRGPGLSF